MSQKEMVSEQQSNGRMGRDRRGRDRRQKRDRRRYGVVELLHGNLRQTTGTAWVQEL